MKNIPRLHYLLSLCIWMLLSTASGYGWPEYTAEGYRYTIDPDGNLWLSRWESAPIVNGSITLPSELPTSAGVSPVTHLGWRVFFQTPHLVEIIIPDSVVYVGSGFASECPDLIRIELGKGVAESYQWEYIAFQSPNLLRIDVDPDNPALASIDGVLFNKNATTLLNFPTGRAGPYTIPESVTTIGVRAFQSTSYLQEIIILDTVEVIAEGAFSSCEELSWIDFGAGVRFIGEGAFVGTAVEVVTIPDQVISIGELAFAGCRELREVHLGRSVTDLHSTAFDFTPLEVLTISAENTLYSAEDNVLYDKAKTAILRVPINREGTFIVPHSVRRVGSYAFSGNQLTHVVLPQNLESIETHAFAYGDLKEIRIPAKVKTIAGNSFFEEDDLQLFFMGDAPDLTSNLSNRSGVHINFLTTATGFGEPPWSEQPSTAHDPLALSPTQWLKFAVRDPRRTMNDKVNGVPLLLSYALSSDLNTTSVISPMLTQEDGTLSIEFFSGRLDIIYQVEHSRNLTDWSTEEVTLTPTGQHNITKATIPGGQFIRFNIKLNPSP